jgi:hypothetical protein
LFSNKLGVDQADKGGLLEGRSPLENERTEAEPEGTALDIRTTSKIKATESRKRKSRGRDRAIIRMIGDMIARLPDRRLSFIAPILLD